MWNFPPQQVTYYQKRRHSTLACFRSTCQYLRIQNSQGFALLEVDSLGLGNSHSACAESSCRGCRLPPLPPPPPTPSLTSSLAERILHLLGTNNCLPGFRLEGICPQETTGNNFEDSQRGPWVGARAAEHPTTYETVPHNQERRDLSTLTSETFRSPRGGSSGRWRLACIHPVLGPSEYAREGVGCTPFSSQKPLVWGVSPSGGVDCDTGAPSREEGKGSPVPWACSLWPSHPQRFLFMSPSFAFSKFDPYATSVGRHK